MNACVNFHLEEPASGLKGQNFQNGNSSQFSGNELLAIEQIYQILNLTLTEGLQTQGGVGIDISQATSFATTVIEALEKKGIEIGDDIENKNKQSKGWMIAGIVLGVVGAIVGIAGLIAAPFTGGASLFLTALGISAAVLGIAGGVCGVATGVLNIQLSNDTKQLAEQNSAVATGIGVQQTYQTDSKWITNSLGQTNSGITGISQSVATDIQAFGAGLTLLGQNVQKGILGVRR